MKNFLLFILPVLFLLFSSSAQAQTSWLDPSGKVTDSAHAAYERVLIQAPDSFRAYYFPGKQLYFEGRILSADQEVEEKNIYAGDCQWYYRNGKKKAERRFTDSGIENGVSRHYHESGKLWKEAEYVNGQLKDNRYLELDDQGNVTEIFRDEFDNNTSGWDLASYPGSSVSLTNGRLHIESLSEDGTSRTISRPLSNGSYMIEAVIDSRNMKGNKYGLVWGFKDWDNYNYLLVSSSYVSIGNIFEGVRFDKLSYVHCSAIDKQGLNTFRLLSDNERLILTVNGEMVNKLAEMRLSGSHIGFVLGDAAELEIERLTIKQFTGKNSSFFAGNDLDIKGSGTGLILSSNGYLVTNNHVVEQASYIYADIHREGSSKTYEARVVMKDEGNDLCILKVEPSEGFPANIDYGFASSTLIAPGSSVFTLGYPLALSGMGQEPKFTDGRISSKTGYNNAINSFQTTIPVQPGNSGSPVFNEKGELVGIINAKVMAADNVSYAVKLNYLKNLYELLPDPVIPSGNKPENLPLTEKISLLSQYVVFIKIK